LREAELIDNKNKFTKLFYLLDKKNINFIYEIIFINLHYNSNLINLFLHNLPFQNKKISFKELEKIIENKLDYLKKITIKNIVATLFNFFDTTPLGKDLKIGYITKEKNIRYIQKIGSNDISNEAILYSLYKLKEHLKRDDFRVSEFYEDGFEGGPYKIFGIDKETLINKLKFISEDTKLIDVNLIQGLDNVFLKDFSAMEILEEVLK
jgi:phosphoadenosine phosphosulfate reductase